MRWCDVAQQVLFAQQPSAHGFSLAVFVIMHEVAVNRMVAVNSAITIAIETVTLRSIDLLNTMINAAHRGNFTALATTNGKRFFARADENLTGFVELESATCAIFSPRDATDVLSRCLSKALRPAVDVE